MSEEERRCLVNNFMHNVVYLRKKHGLTENEMARLLGIGTRSMHKLENGIVPPRMNMDALLAIWNCFGITPMTQLTCRLDGEEPIR